MDSTSQTSTVPAESSTDALTVVPASEAVPPTAESSQPVAEPSASTATAAQEPLPVPSSSSAEVADAAVSGSAGEATPPAEAVPADQVSAAPEQTIAPAVGESSGPVAGEAASIESTQDEPAAALDSASGDQPASGIPPAAEGASSANTTDQRTTDPKDAAFSAQMETTVTAETAVAPQHPASAPIVIDAEQPSSIEPPVAPPTVPETVSTSALPAGPASSDAAPTGAPEASLAPSTQVADGPSSEQPQTSQALASSSEGAPATSVATSEANAVASEPAPARSNATADEPTTGEVAATDLTQTTFADTVSSSQGDRSADTSLANAATTTTERKDGDSNAKVNVAEGKTESVTEATAKTDADPAADNSSSKDLAAAPIVADPAASKTASASVPATPEKKATTDAPSSTQVGTSQPSTPAREGRVALILRINKELIRFCVDLQAKELTMDPVYREAAVRLQANLAYLASVADKAGKSVDAGGRAPPGGALPRLEPFPRSEHAPSSPLPALYDKLIAIFDAARQSGSPMADGKKRSRDSTADLGSENPQKRAASKGVDRSQDVSAAGTPSSSANQQHATAPQPAGAAATTLIPPPSQPQQPSAVPQAPTQLPQQPGQGPDLSLAPPVPIAPPTAAQNIPNNPQAQALMQAFGPSALVNLHALQSHLRGQGTHPWVAYMEASVNGFKTMPLQVQLQHMTTLQNAVLQRQKAMQAGGDTAAGISSPATMSNGGMGATSSPAGTRPGSRHSNSPGQTLASPSTSTFGGSASGRAATLQKRPGSSGSVGSAGRNRTGSSNLAFDPSQMQAAPSPATMASVTDLSGHQPNFGFQPPGLQQGSPAASAGSPAQQPPQQLSQGMMGMPNFQNLPPHLQQQIRQQYMAHMQAQAQQQGQQQGFNPQQQQQQPQQGWNFQAPQ